MKQIFKKVLKDGKLGTENSWLEVKGAQRWMAKKLMKAGWK
jgi:hypothetical protein